jgi:hypothetical protein
LEQSETPAIHAAGFFLAVQPPPTENGSILPLKKKYRRRSAGGVRHIAGGKEARGTGDRLVAVR